jgi:transposase
MQRAQMLLWSAAGKTDVEIATLLSVNPLTVATARERWATEKRIADAPKPGRHKKLDGKQEAFVVALACSDAPEGRESWTLQLLADKLVEPLCAKMDETTSPSKFRIELKGGEQGQSACQSQGKPIQKCSRKPNVVASQQSTNDGWWLKRRSASMVN